MKGTRLLTICILALLLAAGLTACGQTAEPPPASATPAPAGVQAPAAAALQAPPETPEPEPAPRSTDVTVSVVHDDFSAELSLPMARSADAVLSFVVEDVCTSGDLKDYFDAVADRVEEALRPQIEAEGALLSRSFQTHGYMMIHSQRDIREADYNWSYEMLLTREQSELDADYRFLALDARIADEISDDLRDTFGILIAGETLLDAYRLLNELGVSQVSAYVWEDFGSSSLHLKMTIHNYGPDYYLVFILSNHDFSVQESEPVRDFIAAELAPSAALAFVYENTYTDGQVKDNFERIAKRAADVLNAPAGYNRRYVQDRSGAGEGSFSAGDITLAQYPDVSCNYSIRIGDRFSQLQAAYRLTEVSDAALAAIAQDMADTLGIVVSGEDLNGYIRGINLPLKSPDSRLDLLVGYNDGWIIATIEAGYRSGFNASDPTRFSNHSMLDKPASAHVEVDMALSPGAALSFVYTDAYPYPQVEQNYERIAARALDFITSRSDYLEFIENYNFNRFGHPAGTLTIYNAVDPTDPEVDCDYSAIVESGRSELTASYEFPELNDSVVDAILADLRDTVGIAVSKDAFLAAYDALCALDITPQTTHAMVIAHTDAMRPGTLLSDDFGMDFTDYFGYYQVRFRYSLQNHTAGYYSYDS